MSLFRHAINSASRNSLIAARSLRYYATGNGNVLVLIEHNNEKIAAASLSAVTAAKKLGNVTALVCTNNTAIAQQAGKIQGVDKVVAFQGEQFKHAIAEQLEGVLVHLQRKHSFSHIVAPHSTIGKSVLPRLAATFDVSPISDVIDIKSGDEFVRPIYAGNAIQQLSSKDKLKLITVRATAFDKATLAEKEAAIEKLEVSDDVKPLAPVPEWVSEEVAKSDRPELGSARVVISGGRGMKSGDNFKILYELADELGGAVGASRAAVDAGFVPNDLQVGQTGKVVAPELYVAVGISGAIQHLAGMKDSKCIVAINKDAEAPIFQVADYGLVADLFQAVPQLTEAIKKEKSA